MFTLGTQEMLVIGFVVLIVLGPKRIPEAARKIGRVMNEIQRAANEFKRAIYTKIDE